MLALNRSAIIVRPKLPFLEPAPFCRPDMQTDAGRPRSGAHDLPGTGMCRRRLRACGPADGLPNDF